MTSFLVAAFLVSAVLNFICSILILRGLNEAGHKTSFFELRYQVHKHIKTYRTFCQEKTGKTPWPYYAYQGSLAAMIGFVLLILFSLPD
jgi:hypothetical protein